jgi:hypothetical protein
VSGKYTYRFTCPNIKSISIKDFNLCCNVYNITELNNRFNITERAAKSQISIAIGYYKIPELIQSIEIALNEQSPNKLSYKVSLDPSKNKIDFKCTKDGIPHNFNIQFPKEKRHVNYFYSLQEILGFKNSEYMNNDYYVSEYHPNENILQDFMIKLFVDGNEVKRYSSSNDSFGYFERFSIDLNTMFGKSFSPTHFDDPFDLVDDISCNEVAIELWTSDTHIMTRYTNFNIVLAFEM